MMVIVLQKQFNIYFLVNSPVSRSYVRYHIYSTITHSLSDSDSTLPATDDFGSRFLEFDEYSFEQTDNTEKQKACSH
ncbi:unnamed protein product [Schistosoma margrebowiei]|uniref:Uncharacterized protein n=1 Tax=Schistosoma margrebowiei TaxID=48269 RepID=A0AA85AL66_9TREM|nr:unnamed protein product [Schistosoma margrebowiei]